MVPFSLFLGGAITTTEMFLCSWRPPREAEGLMCISGIRCLSAALTCIPTVPHFPGSWAKDGNKEAPEVFLRWQEGFSKVVCTEVGVEASPFPCILPSKAHSCIHKRRSCCPDMLSWVGNRGSIPRWDVLDKPQSRQCCLPHPSTPEAVPRPAGRSRHPSAPPAILKVKPTPSCYFFLFDHWGQS